MRWFFTGTTPPGLSGGGGGGTGDVVGPASSTDNAVPRYDGTTGKLLQNGAGVTITDAGLLRVQAGDIVRGGVSDETVQMSAAGVDLGAGLAVTWYDDAAISSGSASSRILQGSGSPEGAVSAPAGSIYLRSGGGAGTSFYVKESGSGNTGWIGK